MIRSQKSEVRIQKSEFSQSRAGYTLLEMVLATAIFAVLALTASMGVSAIQQTWRKIHYHGERLKNLMAVDRVIELSFRNMIPFTWTDDKENAEKPVFIGDQDRITFAYFHRSTEVNPYAIRFISLYLENGCLMAEYRDTPIISWDKNEEGIQREILAEDVEKISFLYLSTPDGASNDNITWLDGWKGDDNKENPSLLPFAVQLTIQWKNGETYSWLRRTAGSGKREALGMRKKKTT